MNQAHTSPPTEPAAQAPARPPRLPLGLRLLGVKRRPGKRVRFGLNLWGFALVVLLGMGVGMAGFMEYSMHADFCRSCHLMEPYYQAWHESTHKDVQCVDCHFEPGLRETLRGKFEASTQAVKFITGTYGSKPHAEIRDVSCMRDGCHSKRLLEGKIDWPVQTSRGREMVIHFDHTPHLTETRRGKQLRCVSCHSQMVQGQHIVVTLDTCFNCHFKGVEHGRDDQTLGGCRSCHDAPAKEIRLEIGLFKHAEYIDRGVGCENCHADTIAGDGLVPRQVCWNCHNLTEQVAQYGNAPKLHQVHVTEHKVECSSCHLQIVHHLGAVPPLGRTPQSDVERATEGPFATRAAHNTEASGTCSQCHVTAHNAPLDLYRGTGGRGVVDMPSPMFRSEVDCIACHRTQKHDGTVAPFTGQTFSGAQEACNTCHGTKYNESLATWKETSEKHLAHAEQAVARAEKYADRLDAGQRTLLQDAQHNLRMVRYGHGVHNITYSTALLNVAIENANTIVEAVTSQQKAQR